MPVEAVRAALIAAPAVTSLVSAERIEPLRSTQRSVRVPAIVLQRISTVPSNHLTDDGGLDANVVQLDVYADNYSTAMEIAAQCRTAIQAAGMALQSETDGYESDPDPELAHITQTWSVFT